MMLDTVVLAQPISTSFQVKFGQQGKYIGQRDQPDRRPGMMAIHSTT